jgi:hypothetical protein
VARWLAAAEVREEELAGAEQEEEGVAVVAEVEVEEPVLER